MVYLKHPFLKDLGNLHPLRDSELVQISIVAQIYKKKKIKFQNLNHKIKHILSRNKKIDYRSQYPSPQNDISAIK